MTLSSGENVQSENEIMSTQCSSSSSSSSAAFAASFVAALIIDGRC